MAANDGYVIKQFMLILRKALMWHFKGIRSPTKIPTYSTDLRLSNQQKSHCLTKMQKQSRIFKFILLFT